MYSLFVRYTLFMFDPDALLPKINRDMVYLGVFHSRHANSAGEAFSVLELKDVTLLMCKRLGFHAITSDPRKVAATWQMV
jgi:hypothetical protein